MIHDRYTLLYKQTNNNQSCYWGTEKYIVKDFQERFPGCIADAKGNERRIMLCNHLCLLLLLVVVVLGLSRHHLFCAFSVFLTQKPHSSCLAFFPLHSSGYTPLRCCESNYFLCPSSRLTVSRTTTTTTALSPSHVQSQKRNRAGPTHATHATNKRNKQSVS
jgi:hypothetical protein